MNSLHVFFLTAALFCFWLRASSPSMSSFSFPRKLSWRPPEGLLRILPDVQAFGDGHVKALSPQLKCRAALTLGVLNSHLAAFPSKKPDSVSGSERPYGAPDSEDLGSRRSRKFTFQHCPSGHRSGLGLASFLVDFVGLCSSSFGISITCLKSAS
jgi:hypothetical protein